MQEQMKNMLRLFLCCLCGLLLFLPETSAARQLPVHELNYFQSYETKVDGRPAWRIEIGINRPDVAYTVKEKTFLRKELVLDLPNTVRGKLAAQIAQKSPYVSAIHIDELEARHTQVRILLTQAGTDCAYQVTLLEPDRKARKPYRLAIDVFEKPQEASAGSVAGVAGHALVLDAGHGGSDTGAVGPDGVTEASVTLAVTRDVRDILQQSGARVVMTRDADVDVYGPYASDRQELQARVNVGAYSPGTELFVSIHCNAFSNPGAHGMETYYYPKTDADERLAALLNEELAAAGGLFNRGVKEANFYVMKHSSMPASLIELGFITNPREEALLASEEYQKKIALAIARGIGRFFSE